MTRPRVAAASAASPPAKRQAAAAPAAKQVSVSASHYRAHLIILRTDGWILPQDGREFDTLQRT